MSGLSQLHFEEGNFGKYIFSGLCEAGKQLSLKSFIPSMNQEGRREGEEAYLGAEFGFSAVSFVAALVRVSFSFLNNSCDVEKRWLSTANTFVPAEQSSHSKHLEHEHLQISALPIHMPLAGLLWACFSLGGLNSNCSHCQLKD